MDAAKPIKRTVTFISDPGHGWLEVSNADIATLGIADQITPYSYMTPTRSFLEEDCDAGVFMKAAKDAGWSVTAKHRLVDSVAPLRAYSSYSKEWIERPLAEGSEARLRAPKTRRGQKVKVEAIQGRKVILRVEDGMRMQADTTTIFACVFTERQWEESVDKMRRFGPGR